MPAHKDFLGEPRAHVLAAYVWGLSAAEPPQSLVRISTEK